MFKPRQVIRSSVTGIVYVVVKWPRAIKLIDSYGQEVTDPLFRFNNLRRSVAWQLIGNNYKERKNG